MKLLTYHGAAKTQRGKDHYSHQLHSMKSLTRNCVKLEIKWPWPRKWTLKPSRGSSHNFRCGGTLV